MVVIPAEAGIQYAEAPVIEWISRGVLGRPVKPDDDSGVGGERAHHRHITLPAAA
jgi:hypothetical protein